MYTFTVEGIEVATNVQTVSNTTGLLHCARWLGWHKRYSTSKGQDAWPRDREGACTLSTCPSSTTPSRRFIWKIQQSKALIASRPEEVTGKTVEDVSAEQSLPLSTCYRRIRQFVDDGLMILERIVVTKTGKKYAVYRTSFSEVAVKLDGVKFDGGEVSIDIVPNPDVLDKLHSRWLASNYSQSRLNGCIATKPSKRPAYPISGPFE